MSMSIGVDIVGGCAGIMVTSKIVRQLVAKSVVAQGTVLPLDHIIFAWLSIWTKNPTYVMPFRSLMKIFQNSIVFHDMVYPSLTETQSSWHQYCWHTRLHNFGIC